jgi:hypothetical protein
MARKLAQARCIGTSTWRDGRTTVITVMLPSYVRWWHNRLRSRVAARPRQAWRVIWSHMRFYDADHYNPYGGNIVGSDDPSRLAYTRAAAPGAARRRAGAPRRSRGCRSTAARRSRRRRVRRSTLHPRPGSGAVKVAELLALRLPCGWTYRDHSLKKY